MLRQLFRRGQVSIIQRRSQSYVHPVSKLASQLQLQLDQGSKETDRNTNTIYREFKEGLETLNESQSLPLNRSFGLNGPLAALLKRCSIENGRYVEPYQVLNTMCRFEVARSHHFEIVFMDLIKKNSFQDAIALWVKYLECVAENPFTISQSSSNRNGNWRSHEYNAALVTLAYILLPGNVPDLKILKNILQLDAGQTVPFGKVQNLSRTILSDSDQKQVAQDALSSLFRQHVTSDKASFLSHLDGILQLRQLKELYSTYHSSKSDQEDDPEILCKFMRKFTELNRPLEAINIYNQHKKLDSLKMQNELLTAVGSLQSNNRQLKLDRILAIWNSMLKSNASPDSYGALIKAIDASGHVNELKSIYENEIPSEFRRKSVVLEPYLVALVNHGKISISDLLQKSPAKIESVSLVNAILLQMTRDGIPQQEFDKFYQSQFVGGNSPHRPTILSLAIKMWSNWKSDSKEDFQFLQSVSISSKDLIKSNLIIEKFIEIVPNIAPVRKLYEQIKLPLDSRKYGLLLQAEFVKKDGDYHVAEKIFKTFLESCKDQLKKLDRFVLEPMINGFGEMAILQQDSSFLLKIAIYSSLADKLNVTLSNQCNAKILHAAAVLSKVKPDNFSQAEKDFLSNFMQKLSRLDGNFNANPKDLELLRQSNLTAIPPGL